MCFFFNFCTRKENFKCTLFGVGNYNTFWKTWFKDPQQWVHMTSGSKDSCCQGKRLIAEITSINNNGITTTYFFCRRFLLPTTTTQPTTSQPISIPASDYLNMDNLPKNTYSSSILPSPSIIFTR
jgi:hypothetical protein